MDWEGILENDLLPATMAQDEAFICRDFIVSTMQASRVRVRMVSNLFLRVWELTAISGPGPLWSESLFRLLGAVYPWIE